VSHYMTALAMKQQGLKPATKIVLYWLADHHNGETGKCFPSLARLCKVTEMGKTALVGHLDTLEKLGLIERLRKYDNNGAFKSTDYVLTLKDDTLVRNTDNPCSDFAPPLVRNANTNLVSNNLGSKPYTSSKDDEVNYYFDQLWEMYPRKVGKGQARKAYVAASKKIDFFDLLPKLEAYVATLDGKDKQYMPHLATWLNGERWADEV
jgi:DNA-binding MarR family transcriptional regulator